LKKLLFEMEIRKLSISEIDKFHLTFSRIIGDGFPEYSQELVDFIIEEDFKPEVLKEKLEKKEYTILVAEEEKSIVGFLIFEKLYGGVSYCTWLGVLREFRGKGIGRQLLATWEKEILLQGGHKLMLLTQAEKNKIFYEKCGFEEEGLEKESWFGLDALIFGKIIGKPNPEIFYQRSS